VIYVGSEQVILGARPGPATHTITHSSTYLARIYMLLTQANMQSPGSHVYTSVGKGHLCHLGSLMFCPLAACTACPWPCPCPCPCQLWIVQADGSPKDSMDMLWAILWTWPALWWYSTYSLRFKTKKVMFYKTCGLRVIFRTLSTKPRALLSSHEAISSELGVSIIKLKFFVRRMAPKRMKSRWDASTPSSPDINC
jgi:hypothetical protein